MGLLAPLGAGAAGTGRISGSVRGDGGEPVPYVCIALAPVGGGSSFDWTAGADGTFAFDAPAGEYRVAAAAGLCQGLDWEDAPPAYRYEYYPGTRDAASATIFSIKPGGRVGPLRFVLTLKPGYGWISGTVLGDDGPPAHSCVVALPPDTTGVHGGAAALTKTGGRYHLYAPAGRYRIGFNHQDCDSFNEYTVPEWYDDRPTLEEAGWVTIRAGRGLNGIDTMLRQLPMMRLTELRVDPPPESPVDGERRITVTAENNGRGFADDALLDTVACAQTSGRCTGVALVRAELASGETRTWSFAWDTTSFIGSVTIRARLLVPGTARPIHDEERVGTSVLVEAMGAGI